MRISRDVGIDATQLRQGVIDLKKGLISWEKLLLQLSGTGIVGERIINQLLQNTEATIVALFDENGKRLQEMADTYGLYAASSYDEVLSLKPDWVYIGTPPVSHATLSRTSDCPRIECSL